MKHLIKLIFRGFMYTGGTFFWFLMAFGMLAAVIHPSKEK